MLLIKLFQLLVHDPVQFAIVFTLLTIPLLISITIHEWSHGMVAYLFGDPTPKKQGRLTLNPLAHLDPVGTLMLFLIGIGWAKPVEININNIPSRTKQMLVALAGPVSNFILAVIFSLIVYGLVKYFSYANLNSELTLIGSIIAILKLIIQINIILAIFNLLPIPPLDGSNVLKWILPESLANAYLRLAPFGMVILLLLLFTVGFNFIFVAAQKVEVIIFKIIEQILSPIFGIM